MSGFRLAVDTKIDPIHISRLGRHSMYQVLLALSRRVAFEFRRIPAEGPWRKLAGLPRVRVTKLS